MLVTGWFLFPQARKSNPVGRTQTYICVPKFSSSTQSWSMKDGHTLETSEVSFPVFSATPHFSQTLIKNATDDFGSFSHSLWWLILTTNLTTFVTNENPSCWVFLWRASLIKLFETERPYLNLFSALMKGPRRWSFCWLPVVLNSCWQVHLSCCGSYWTSSY